MDQQKIEQIKELIELYCTVKNRENIIIDTSEIVLLCILAFVNIVFWVFKMKKSSRPAITLDP